MATDADAGSTTPDTPSCAALGEGAFADLSGSGFGPLAFAAPATGLGRALAVVLDEQQVNADDHVSAWVATTGKYLPGYPHHMEDLQFLTGPSIADVGGTPLPEIVEGSAGYFLHAYDASGAEPTGWPKFTGGWHVANAAIGDVDGDGLSEVVTLTREGNLYIWDTSAPVGSQEWPKKRHDLRNTGNYHTPQGQTGSTVHNGPPSAMRARLSLPAGTNNDRLRLRAILALAAGSDGIDPHADGLSVSLDSGAYDLPASGFTPRRSGWRYRDPTGQGSSPHGITKAILKRQRDGTFKVSVSGRDLDLSRYDGTDDRTIVIGLETGNDHGTATAPFRRAGHNLRTP